MRSLVEKSRLVVAAVGIILAAVYASTASTLRLPIFSDPVGPRTVPYVIAVCLALSCVALIAEHFVVAKRRRADGALTDVDEKPTSVALVVLPMLAGYYLIFERLGFIASTTLFLSAFLAYTNRGQWRVNVSVALIFPVAAYLLLVFLLGARLPLGILAIG